MNENVWKSQNRWGLRPLWFLPWDFPRDSNHHDTPSVFPHIVPLSTVHSPLSTVHCPLSTVHCPLSTVHCPLSTVLYLLSIVHCPLSTVHCPLSIVHCPLSNMHCTLSSRGLFTLRRDIIDPLLPLWSKLEYLALWEECIG